MDHIQNRPMDGRSIVAKENVNSLPMIKRLAFGAIAGALALAPLSARADGFYLNPEWNGAWSGSDFGGAVFDAHVGWEKR